MTAALLSVARAEPQPSPGHENEAEGRRQYKIGDRLLAEGKYREAVQAFEAGYAASPRAGFLLNIGNCYRKLGDLGKARQYYWRFLDGAPKGHPSRTEVLEFLKTIEQINADGVPLEDAGRPPVALPPVPAPQAGSPTPARSAPSQQPVSTAAGPSSSLLSIADKAPIPPEQKEVRQPSVFGRWWFWTLVGGAVAAGTGTLIWARSRSASPACDASLGCLNE